MRCATKHLTDGLLWAYEDELVPALVKEYIEAPLAACSEQKAEAIAEAEAKVVKTALAWYRGDVGDKLLHGKLWNAARALHFAKRKAKA